MEHLTSNHLYRATAPLLTEDPQQDTLAKPEPPHKFWRASFEFTGTRQELQLAHYLNHLLGSNALWLNADGSLVLDGPIYASKEECETKQLAAIERMSRKSLSISGLPSAWKFIAAEKVNEHGAPL